MDKVATSKNDQCIWIDYFTEPVNDSYQKRCTNEYTHKVQSEECPAGGHYCGLHTEILRVHYKEQITKIIQYVTQEEWDEIVAQEQRKARLEELHTMPYREYLFTPEWQERRRRILERDEYRCQICNSPHRLNVHHRDYSRRGYENDTDLVTLCQGCHQVFHENGRLVRVEA